MLQFPKFKESQNLICKTDLESLIISKLLTKYKNNKIVGYSTDRHLVLTEGNEIILKDCLFINKFILKEGYNSISNTVSSFDVKHNENLLLNNGTINPNLFRYRHINSNAIYATRCPFSTLLLTIAMLESEGVDLLNSIDINKEITMGSLGLKWYTTADIILLFGDMFDKIRKNKQNLFEWYNWVDNVLYGGLLNKKHLFYQLFEYLKNNKNIKFWSETKTKKFKDYLSKELIVDKYLSFDEEQLVKSDIVYKCDKFINNSVFLSIDDSYFNKQINDTSVYKLTPYYGEIKKDVSHDPFFFQFITKEKVKYSYNLEKLY